ncbi:hypothetical protein GCM10027088_64690 [Nocardia goodfellowii]
MPSSTLKVIGIAGDTPTSPFFTGATSFGLISSVIGFRSIATAGPVLPEDDEQAESPSVATASKIKGALSIRTDRPRPKRISNPVSSPDAVRQRADGFGSNRLHSSTHRAGGIGRDHVPVILPVRPA